jgi:hypothetical protein
LPKCRVGEFNCQDLKGDADAGTDESDSDTPDNPIARIPFVGGILNWLVDGDKVALAARDMRESETTRGKVGARLALALLAAVAIVPGGGKAGGKAGQQIHHIATDKSVVSGFTAVFEGIFAKAGMSLSAAENKMLMNIANHLGRHSPKYHNYVLQRLRSALQGKKGADYAKALVTELADIGKEVRKNPRILKGEGLP